MKVVFVNRYFYPDHSATSQMLTDLAFALAKQGMDVTVVTSRQHYDDAGAELPKQERINKVNIMRVATPSFGRANLMGRLLDYLGFYLSATATLFRLVDKHTLVVAKTDPPLISIPCAIVCRLRGARLINWLQDLFPEVAIALKIRGIDCWLGRLLMRWRNWSLRTAVMNVAIGERMRGILLNEGIPDHKITVIHNWADGDAIRPVPADENPLRKEWGLEGKFVVGYSGNLGRAHEFDTLIGAAEFLKGQADIVFLFIGGGAQAQLVQEAASARQLTNLLFKPYQPREQLHYSLGAADVHLVILRPELEGLIVPSKYYGIVAAGRPTIFIGAENGEVARIIGESDCGESVAPGDAAGLANKIIAMRANLAGSHSADNARKRFEQDFNLPVAMKAWREVIERAM